MAPISKSRRPHNTKIVPLQMEEAILRIQEKNSRIPWSTTSE